MIAMMVRLNEGVYILVLWCKDYRWKFLYDGGGGVSIFGSKEDEREEFENLFASEKEWSSVCVNLKVIRKVDMQSSSNMCLKTYALCAMPHMRINTFVDFITELVEESTKKDEAETTQEGSLKRTRDDLEQERSKKMEDDKESAELKKCLEIIQDDGDDITIYATPLSSKSPTIADYKIYKEGKKNYF
uniref:Uncharacterized protein n=1 Tax=Tanacetum cinerariifolium TaxID=118510 RepID=A0A6L2PAV9_TANCI|nr:hypothetical protein [Tanacetum cinerariifolium]